MPLILVSLRSVLRLHHLYSLIVVLAFLAGCSEYSRVLKSDDKAYKFEKAVEYYKEGDCFKALPILEELIGLERGTQKAEEVYYYYAQAHYCIGDFYLANYYFKNFTRTYPNSKYSEECLFLAAMCSYENSPSYSLEQGETRNAIDEFQLFMDRYPQSSLRDSCNSMITQLRGKLERKSFEVARLYYTTMRYKSAVMALQESLREFPDSRFREESLFLIVKSQYLLAQNSVDEKKLERFEETTKFYLTFVAAFPQSSWIREAESYFADSIKQIEKLKGNSAQQ